MLEYSTRSRTMLSADGWARCLLVASLVMGLGLVGCGPSEEEVAEAARVEEWAALQTVKQELDQMRVELADLRAQRAAAAEEPAEDAEELTEEAKAELESQFNNLDYQVQNKTQEFGQRLVNFINDDPMEAGAQPTERQLASLRMMADEDLLVADEYGEVGGDWKRAITIAETALARDPANSKVQERLEFYQSMRYMSEERFASAEVGMTPDEVKAAIGVPSRGNDREFSETRRAFYYLKGEDRSAAAVFFQKRGDRWEAYKVDYNALAAPDEG